MYTSAEYIRPWQVNGKYSEAVANYLGMESSVRLGNHQIDGLLDIFINTVFVQIARIRNKFLFYKFPVDKMLYKSFVANFYRKKALQEKDAAEQKQAGVIR